MNPNASSSTPSDEGRDELEALAKDGELLPRSLDLTVTQVLYRSELGARRVKQLGSEKRRKVVDGVERVEELKPFASEHLTQKAKGGKVTAQWLEAARFHLLAASDFFGDDRDVGSITTADVTGYANHLQTVSNGRGGTLSAASQRHYLNSLSNLFRRAQSDGLVTPGYNPVAALMEKPAGKPAEAHWLESHEAALLLESARTYRPGPDAHAGPIYPLLAVLLLTGGRTSEVLGLEIDDISFQRQTITFRPNPWRRLKTMTSHRSVRLWPQAEEILRAYFADKERHGGLGRLLFPSPVMGSESLITDFRKALDAVAGRCGWEKGEIRSKMFRHTYCSARLQTLDGGAPVSEFTVGRELGHGGDFDGEEGLRPPGSGSSPIRYRGIPARAPPRGPWGEAHGIGESDRLTLFLPAFVTASVTVG